MKKFISSTVIALMLCFSAFAVPKIDIDVGTPAAVDSIQKASPAAAVPAINHFAVATFAASVFEVAISPPDIAITQSDAAETTNRIDARACIQINGNVTAASKSPPNILDANALILWTPNIRHGPQSVPPEYQTARSGSFE